jgi:hypothetical protein
VTETVDDLPKSIMQMLQETGISKASILQALQTWMKLERQANSGDIDPDYPDYDEVKQLVEAGLTSASEHTRTISNTLKSISSKKVCVNQRYTLTIHQLTTHLKERESLTHYQSETESQQKVDENWDSAKGLRK